MPTSKGTDIVILGAGLAGLTLATKLLSRSSGLNVIVIGPEDTRNQYVSFWIDKDESTPFTPFLLQKWQRWGFNHAKSGFITQSSQQKSYVSMDARMYKAHLERQLERTPCQRIRARVTDVRVNSGSCDIHMGAETLTAATVIDTRPPRIPETTLKQQFWGATVDLSRAHGISAPILMDFDVKPIADDGITFIYILPLSSSQLLVEATTFSTHPQSVRDYKDCVSQWVINNLSSEVKLDSGQSEVGILPMGPVLPIEPELPNCGLAGGAARPSTGYAFTGTERQTERLVMRILAGLAPDTKTPFSARANWMDKVFLRVAKRQPERLIELFMAMAQRLSGDDFADFLSDTGGWLPCWRTIYVAPKLPFIQAAATTLLDQKWR
jgi:lycopene beta-cyclase